MSQKAGVLRPEYLCIFLAAAMTAAVAAPVFAEAESPDYPAEHCAFLQAIPYDEPIDPNSDVLIQDLQDINPDSRFRIALNEWGMSAYWINGTNYQLEDIYCSEGWCPVGFWMRDVPVPTDQDLNFTADADANLSIVDPIHGMEYNFWACNGRDYWKRNRNGYYECRASGYVFTNTSGSNPVACSMRGPSIAHSIGLCRPGELAAGTVYHGLAYSIVQPAAGPCPPATYSDADDFGDVQYPYRLPEAAAFRLKPSVWTDQAIENATYPDSTPWNFTEKTLAKAARDYGIYVTDNTGCAHLYANSICAYPSDPYADIDGLRPDQRNPRGTYARLWPEYFLDPANFEVVDRVFFPYPRDDRYQDYDGDSITNAAETAWGYRDYTVYVEHNDPSNGPLDWDNDGLTNAQECELRKHFRYEPLNPFDADTDGDGYSDFEEALDWSADPTNPFRGPDPAWPGLPSGPNLALGKPVTAVNFTTPEAAVDGSESTAAEAPEGKVGSLTVDLGSAQDITRVVIKWLGIGHCFGVGYTVEVSPDASQWTVVHTETEGEGGIDDIYNLSANGRYVKVDVTDLGSPWGLHIHELEAYGLAGPQPPVADFSGNPTSGPPPLTVYFTDLSANAPTSWDWTFGDGGVSQAQHPSHDYTAVNTYTVSLQACNAQGCDTETKPDYITVSDQSCHVGAIDMADGSPPSYRAEATVTVHDQDCQPLGGVTVDITWSGAVSATDSDVTDANGQVTFVSPKNRQGGTFTCCVDNLTKDGYPYQSGDNHETCDSVTLP